MFYRHCFYISQYTSEVNQIQFVVGLHHKIAVYISKYTRTQSAVYIVSILIK